MRVSLRLVGMAVLAAAGAAQAQTSPTPAFTAQQAKRGAEFYSGSCAVCHGEGVDDGQFAPPLKGPAHKAYWTGKTAEDLLTYMAANMPPAQPGGLGAQAYADIFAFLLQSAGAPAGDKELPAEAAALRDATPTLP